VIGGEPGIGKTTLWRATLERARDRGMRVLVTRPAEEEMPMSGIGLVDLFERADTGAALPTLDDPFTTGRAVLENLRTLVDRGPVILAIDDLPWLDSVTARALRYSLRRFRTEPVAVVVVVRRDATASIRYRCRRPFHPSGSASSSRVRWASTISGERSAAS
jgi:predicted ATPase